MLAVDVYEPDDDEAPDYNKWHVVLDASLSRKHEMPDHFFPVEVVSPVIVADESWTKVIDKFWSVILEHFELRRDTTCGFHVHISTRRGNYTLEELRMMAKAVVFWEPATKRMTPCSRHDECLDFCKSNILADVPVNDVLRTDGPLRGLVTAYGNIDRCDRDAIIDYICPDKYRAWNFKPAKTGGSGSIEFRRPPGVVDAKKAKHWIAFAMTFVDMASQFNPSALADHLAQVESLHTLYLADFEQQFLECAKRLGTFAILDARLRQTDQPRYLHITLMHSGRLAWLQGFDRDYQMSRNA